MHFILQISSDDTKFGQILARVWKSQMTLSDSELLLIIGCNKLTDSSQILKEKSNLLRSQAHL